MVSVVSTKSNGVILWKRKKNMQKCIKIIGDNYKLDYKNSILATKNEGSLTLTLLEQNYHQIQILKDSYLGNKEKY